MSATATPSPAAEIKADLVEDVRAAACEDLAFIGNASDVYAWVPCRMVDLDVFLFAEALDARLGHWLLDRAERWRDRLARQGTDFELRIVEGPYKPAIDRLTRPIVVLHMGVFTEPSYLAQPPLKRWAWRKYTCLTGRNPIVNGRRQVARAE